ncbi:MAG: hypothetical protein QGH85_00415 [Candidatus Pacebacteria bacterium]|nr:hypothetical protein [Candidatus Paceibacterota bacterium]MDP7466086.1 hypothetical protein [Candidatus Paceibacterota bacterium]MDP7648217.1 hypothetical protein [Candidatus Paceibacterota bacterium]
MIIVNMAKNAFQDIVPSKKRTIRDVQNSRSRAHKPIQKTEDDFEYDTGYDDNIRKPRSSRFALWFVAGVVIIVLVLAFSLLFAGAKVSITPKQNKTLVDAQFVAALDGVAGELAYEIMTIEKTDSKKIEAAGREEIEEKASGRLVIFNDFNTSSQRLIKNTRFETPEGLVYRINRSVVVPGQKTEDGEKVPGSLEVTVYADEAGDKFNIGLTDFTVPGFKGSPRFDSFYARSKTPMTGGFIGEKLTADPVDVEKAKSEIHTDLKEQLLNEAFSQSPDEFYLFEDGVFVEFESQSQAEAGDEVEIIEKAILYGVLFNKEKFASHIAENTLVAFDEGAVSIADISTLTVTAIDKEEARPWEDEEFEFSVGGNAHIVWTFDEEKLKNDLSSRAKAALPTVLSGYPSIGQAEVVLRPFWKRSFPDKVSKIKIETVLDN